MSYQREFARVLRVSLVGVGSHAVVQVYEAGLFSDGRPVVIEEVFDHAGGGIARVS